MTFLENDICLWVFEGCVPASPARRPGDFLGFIVKRGATGKLEAEYRFRWHAGASFDANDEKSFWQVSPVADTPEARARLLGAFRRILSELETPWECEVNGDMFKMHELMQNGPLTTRGTTALGAPFATGKA